MVDTDIPKIDRTKREAALWATVVAVPVTILVGVIAFFTIQPEKSDKELQKAIPTTPVVMEAPKLDERATLACRAITSQLPDKIRDLAARPVSAGPEQNAAYGEPPITVSCGVPQPETCKVPGDTTPGCVPMDTELLVMNNVCWYAKAADGTDTFTTMDREVPVRVSVPSSFDKSAQWANEFSDTVVATIKSKDPATTPYGCK